MGRMKVVAALTGVTLVLLSAVVIFTVRSDSGTSHATTVVSQSSGDASAPAGTSPERAARRATCSRWRGSSRNSATT